MKDQQETRGHDRFSELCALAMSGSLTAAENADLQQHLETCVECHDEYERYLLLTREGMPLLARRYAGQETREELIPELAGDDCSFDSDSAVAREKILARIALTEPSLASHSLAESEPHKRFPFPIGWHALVKPLSAGIAACLLIVASYVFYQSLQHKDVAAQHRIETLASEKMALADQLSTQTKQLTQVEFDASQKHEEIEQLQAELRAGQRETQQASEQASALTAAKATSEEQARSAAHDRETLAARLNDLEAAYKTAQAELVNLRTERDRTTLKLASLENDNAALIASSRDQERRLGDQQQFLSSDRDIRELMGARQLYMADVFDVSSDSRTRKPYGRIFYTKGRSLIFYAFDLDHQPGIKNAAFQAWGRNESSQGTPFNLGILFQDSEQNRRWVLRFDNPQRLAEIDAIFVTVEPHGGSQKPSGKPFLYASLRREPNHP
jgi:hypothetical protein